MLSNLKQFEIKLSGECSPIQETDVICRRVSADPKLGFIHGCMGLVRDGYWQKENKGRGSCVEEE